MGPLPRIPSSFETSASLREYLLDLADSHPSHTPPLDAWTPSDFETLWASLSRGTSTLRWRRLGELAVLSQQRAVVAVKLLRTESCAKPCIDGCLAECPILIKSSVVGRDGTERASKV